MYYLLTLLIVFGCLCMFIHTSIKMKKKQLISTSAKHLLYLLEKYDDIKFFGLCGVVNHAYYQNEISADKNEQLFEWIQNNYPTPEIYTALNCEIRIERAYYFERGNIQLRKNWLKYLISNPQLINRE